MKQLINLAEKLKKNGFNAVCFSSKEEVKKFLLEKCKNKIVGTGGSATISELDILPVLQNTAKKLYARQLSNERALLQDALTAEIFLLSANAISEDDGVIVNIDGRGNRVAGSIYGPDEIVFIIGKNKLCKNLSECLQRLKEVAPRNAKRLGIKTPCTTDGKCHECNAPDCICRITVLHHKAPKSTPTTVLLINETLGY